MPNIIAIGNIGASQIVVDMFVTLGNTVQNLTVPLDFDSTAIAGADVVVWASTASQDDLLTMDEAAVLRDYVAGGGTLMIVVDDPTNASELAEVQSLAATVGISASVGGTQGFGVASYSENAYTQAYGLTGGSFFGLYAPIVSNAATVIAATDMGEPVVTRETVGAGGGQVFMVALTTNFGAGLAAAVTTDLPPAPEFALTSDTGALDTDGVSTEDTVTVVRDLTPGWSYE